MNIEMYGSKDFRFPFFIVCLFFVVVVSLFFFSEIQSFSRCSTVEQVVMEDSWSFLCWASWRRTKEYQ